MPVRSFNSITTVVLHHPDRPIDCLLATLDSLVTATSLNLVVEVIVQGLSADGSFPELPPVDSFPFEMSYQINSRNTGNSLPLAQSAARCRTDLWSKLDDDTILPGGGWDLLLKALQVELDVLGEPGEFDIGAVAFGHHDSIPRLLRVADGYLYRVPGSYAKHEQDGIVWEVSDFGSNGATIYLPEVFERGCEFDPIHFVVSEHIDMGLQMVRKGFTVIQVMEPLAPHHKDKCTPIDYYGVRLLAQNIIDGFRRLEEKWGLCDVALHKNAFGHFPEGTEEIFVAGGPASPERLTDA